MRKVLKPVARNFILFLRSDFRLFLVTYIGFYFICRKRTYDGSIGRVKEESQHCLSIPIRDAVTVLDDRREVTTIPFIRRQSSYIRQVSNRHAAGPIIDELRSPPGPPELPSDLGNYFRTKFSHQESSIFSRLMNERYHVCLNMFYAAFLPILYVKTIFEH